MMVPKIIKSEEDYNSALKRIEEIGLFNWEITILDSDYFDKQ